MSTDDFLAKYESALKAQLTAEINVRVLEMRAKLTGFTETEKPKKKQKPKPPEPTGLETGEQGFYSARLRTPQEVIEFLCLPRAKVYRLLKNKTLKFEQSKGPGTRKWVITQSVLEYSGKTET